MEPEPDTLLMSSTLINQWNQSLAGIISRDYDDTALPDLLSALEQLVDGKSSSLVVCPQGEKPFAACHTLMPDEDPAVHIDQYLSGAYLVDPCYLMAREQQLEGFCTTLDIAPDGFETSEYYRIYYHATDLKNDAVFVIHGPQNSVVLLSIGRHTDAPNFESAEKTLLHGLFPLIKVLVAKRLQNHQSVRPEHRLEPDLDLALQHFGTSVLTQRENVILNYLLRGHSIKSVAERLTNSIETIKHHRKNIYLKLDVSSQAELFHLFIDSLRSYNPARNKDPLVAYMSI